MAPLADVAPQQQLLNAAIPIALVGLVLAIQAAGVSIPLVGRHWARPAAAGCPTELLPELDRLSASPSARIFNDLAFGGFLIYHCPHLAIFIDDRCELYGPKFLTAYEHMRTVAPADLEAWRQRYHFTAALVESDSPLDAYLAQGHGWQCVGRSFRAALYRRPAQGL